MAAHTLSEQEVPMAVKRPVVVDPGTVLAKVVHGKKIRQQPGKQIVPSNTVTVHKTLTSPAESSASPERTAAFDPRLFLERVS